MEGVNNTIVDMAYTLLSVYAGKKLLSEERRFRCSEELDRIKVLSRQEKALECEMLAGKQCAADIVEIRRETKELRARMADKTADVTKGMKQLSSQEKVTKLSMELAFALAGRPVQPMIPACVNITMHGRS